MARSVGITTGINLLAGFGTGSNDRLMPISNYEEAYLQTADAFPSNPSRGPIYGFFVLRTANVISILTTPGWCRSDANYSGSDAIHWRGHVLLASEGGNELIPALRNDTSVNTT